jgi:hypothetical protein
MCVGKYQSLLYLDGQGSEGERGVRTNSKRFGNANKLQHQACNMQHAMFQQCSAHAQLIDVGQVAPGRWEGAREAVESKVPAGWNARPREVRPPINFRWYMRCVVFHIRVYTY